MPAHKKDEILIPTGFRLTKRHKRLLKAEHKAKGINPSEIVRDALDKRYRGKK